MRNFDNINPYLTGIIVYKYHNNYVPKFFFITSLLKQ